MKHAMNCTDCRYLSYTVCTNNKARIGYVDYLNSYCTGFRFSFRKIIKYELSKIYWNFNISLFGFAYPKYCPHCGNKWIIKKTPTRIVEEIKRLYHEEHNRPERSGREDKMESLLNQLKEMAEK